MLCEHGACNEKHKYHLMSVITRNVVFGSHASSDFMLPDIGSQSKYLYSKIRMRACTHKFFQPKKIILTCESQFILSWPNSNGTHCQTYCAEVLYVNAEACLTNGVQNKYSEQQKKRSNNINFNCISSILYLFICAQFLHCLRIVQMTQKCQ